MANQKDDDDEENLGEAAGERTGDFAVESLAPDETPAKPDGPPEKYRKGSWYDRVRADWWFDSLPDPCPVRPLGHGGGFYSFVSPQGEMRKFTSPQLHRSGGLADLFAARLWWATRHFPGYDKRTGEPTGRPNPVIAAEAMMRACIDTGYISSDVEHRLAGTWRGPDGRPIVHCGDVLVRDGEIMRPGTRLGAPLYVIAGRRERPTLAKSDGGVTRYADVPPLPGHNLVGAILNWAVSHDGGAELVAGFIAAAMYGDATMWRSHIYLLAQPGSGKSTLLLLIRAALGGAGHDILDTYSAAHIEQRFSRQACAIITDEMESDADPSRMRRVAELVKLLSGQGGTRGGRGSSGGEAREIDVRGAVCMAATTRGQRTQAEKTRISVIELGKLRQEGRRLAPDDEIQALIARAESDSPMLRARMLSRWALFQENLARARQRVIELGGDPRDANQLGHLLAGWWTLTNDEPADEAMVADVGRFSRWIVTVSDAEEGSDPASECWNRMLGGDAHVWRGGETLTVGQVIARARGEGNESGISYRKALLGMGLRLLPADDKRTPWYEADLGIANKHPGLERVFFGSEFANGRWADILPNLEIVLADGSRFKASSHGPVRFGGPQSRGVLIPAAVLPSIKDEEP